MFETRNTVSCLLGETTSITTGGFCIWNMTVKKTKILHRSPTHQDLSWKPIEKRAESHEHIKTERKEMCTETLPEKTAAPGAKVDVTHTHT
jgi:hypothetical protein